MFLLLVLLSFSLLLLLLRQFFEPVLLFIAVATTNVGTIIISISAIVVHIIATLMHVYIYICVYKAYMPKEHGPAMLHINCNV